MEPITYYKSQSEKHKHTLRQYQKQRNFITITKILIFAIIVWQIYIAINDGTPYFLYPSLPSPPAKNMGTPPIPMLATWIYSVMTPCSATWTAQSPMKGNGNWLNGCLPLACNAKKSYAARKPFAS